MGVKNFIEKIQNSEERVKRRWMILFSVAAVMVIVALWVVSWSPFFGFGPATTNKVAVQVDEPGFWQIFKNSVNVVFGALAENFKNLIAQITNKKTIVIE